MSPQQKALEISFNKRYSRFKVQIFFKNRLPITHHGIERKQCTVSQIIFGHIDELVLHRDEGLKNCIDRIELCKKLYGPFTTAIIFDNNYKTILPDGTALRGREVIKYVGENKVEDTTPEEIFKIFPAKVKVKVVSAAPGDIKIIPFEKLGKNEAHKQTEKKENLPKDLKDLTKLLTKKM